MRFLLRPFRGKSEQTEGTEATGTGLDRRATAGEPAPPITDPWSVVDLEPATPVWRPETTRDRALGRSRQTSRGRTPVPARGPVDPETEKQLLQALAHLAAGEWTAMAEACAELPEPWQEALEHTARDWAGRLLALQRALAQALEDGFRLLTAAQHWTGEAGRFVEEHRVRVATVWQPLADSATAVSGRVAPAGVAVREAVHRMEVAGGGMRDVSDRLAAGSLRARSAREPVAELTAALAPLGSLLEIMRQAADQIHLLAVRAALEAARAAAHGESFAMVADELRRVAERVDGVIRNGEARVRLLRERAGQLDAAVAELDQRLAEAIPATRKGQEALAAAEGYLAEALRATESAEAAARAHAEEMAAARDALSAAPPDAELREVATALTHTLLTQQATIADVLSRAGVPEPPPSAGDEAVMTLARVEHLVWLQRLKAMRLQGFDTAETGLPAPDRLSDPAACRLGQWCSGPAAERLSGEPAFQRLAETHRRWHETAARALTARCAGDPEEAASLLDEALTLGSDLLRRCEELERLVAPAPGGEPLQDAPAPPEPTVSQP